MTEVEQEVDRYLSLLRNKMRQRGFTQMEVQDTVSTGLRYKVARHYNNPHPLQGLFHPEVQMRGRDTVLLRLRR